MRAGAVLVACRAAVDADSDTTPSEGSTHGSSDVLHALCAPLGAVYACKSELRSGVGSITMPNTGQRLRLTCQTHLS